MKLKRSTAATPVTLACALAEEVPRLVAVVVVATMMAVVLVVLVLVVLLVMLAVLLALVLLRLNEPTPQWHTKQTCRGSSRLVKVVLLSHDFDREMLNWPGGKRPAAHQGLVSG